MNNGSYFSQYESPNIVIVPTRSCNPPSPKRKKLGNNIVVPIVNNVAGEKQKLKLSQESNRTDNSMTCKSVVTNEINESSSTIPTSLKGSWAANYLQSIGLDKKSSIWNRKIPRKSASQRCIVTVEQSKITTEVSPTSTCTTNRNIENGNQLNIPNKVVTNLNTLKDSNTNIKRNFETQNRSIKESKQSNHEPKKSVLVKNTIVSKNKTVNILMQKNKNILKDQNKIKSHNIQKNKSIAEPIKLSGNHNLHIKTGKRINTTSQKDRTLKFATESVPKSCRQKCQNIVEEKSKIKSVVVKKDHVEDRRKSSSKIGHNLTTEDSAKLSARYACSKYKEKSNNSKCSTEKVTSINNIKTTEKEDKHNNLNKSNSKNPRQNSELKNKVVRNTLEVNNRTKTKEKTSKSKSGLKSATKTIKSPIKRKPSKSKRERKIKIVINLICNQNPNSAQTHETPCNESSDGSTTCTVSNVDLDFLNDFDIDEIVESLDTCEKKQSDRNLSNFQSKGDTDKENIIHNNKNSYKNNMDAIDLIKTLKGEEDDDLMKISIENGNDFLISKVENDVTPGNEKPHNNLLDMESKVDNDIILNISSQIQVKAEENEVFDTVGKVFEQSFSAAGNSSNEKIININPVHFVESKNINKDEIAKGSQETSLKIQLDMPSNNSSQSVLDDRNKNGTSEDKSNELMNSNNSNTQIINEKNISPFVADACSSSVFNKVNTDSNKGFKFDKDITENINEAKLDHNSLDENKVVNENSQELNSNVGNLCFVDENEKPLTDTSPKKISGDNNNKIVDEKSAILTYSSNALITETNSKDNNFTNKSPQNDNAAYNLQQLKPEMLDNTCLVNADKQEACNNNDKSTKATKDAKNTDKENDNITNNSVCKRLQQQNPVNVETKNDQDNVALVSNNVKDEATSISNESQENRDDSDKVQSNFEENLLKNKQKDSPDPKNETLGPQRQLSNSDEHTIGNIKSKDDEQSILEQGLLTCTGSKYSIISLIRKGKFSKIFRCKHPNGKHYALKMPTTNIKFNLGKEKAYMLDSLISDIPKENLFIVCLVKGFNVGKNWCFLMEYYPKNLDQVLSEAEKPLSINQIQDYARQLVMAVMVLRNKSMVHLDIKPKHILINSSNNMLKLCGFDNLCYINRMNVLPNIGTVNYRAPEVIIGYNSDFEVDVWSTGLVLYEMATNKKLFPGIYNNDILYKQMCTLGAVPYKMVRKSRFGSVHFVGWKFMRKSGFKGQNISLISKFNKSNKLCDSIYASYFQNWGGKSTCQQAVDLAKIDLFVKLLQKMLVIHPESRLPIEFVYSNPFIYDAYSYQKW